MQYKKSFTHKDFASVLSEYSYNLDLGDIVAGTIFNKESQGFLVDIGASIAAYLPTEEISLTMHNQNQDTLPLVNETREFFILAYNRNSKQLLLSIRRLDYMRAWERIKQIENEDIILDLSIDGINKGGLLTTIEGLQGFLPNSHISDINGKESLLKKNLKCKFLIADEKTNKIIFSNRCALLSIMEDKLKVGQIINGEIISIQAYGLFIRIQGIAALLHISEIGYKHIENIENKFQIGSQIKVKVIHIDTIQGRLSVSRRNLV
uniref:Ribosomal protein S1 n=1 Tax=Ahnfeltia plicata TaxID=28023 RepID=A0A1C9CB87_9FLOR|nr:ribosomal protein S1 [Ahnfeltia plicata]AOM65637.1 ribosomal protein S1 [Ahnfeltia plicata]UAT97168.1 ribosomal protein S1 [Ahnfeltia plicata]UAT97373.1 ribosomal protein S1 [Ahnfeltia plicata]